MNARTFLQQFEESHDRDRLVDVVYDEMVEFCQENDITTDDISTPMLERLAEGFVTRGLGVPESDDTVLGKSAYRSEEFERKFEAFREIDPELIEELKRISKEDKDYEFRVTE